jgi:hypothetical protein
MQTIPLDFYTFHSQFFLMDKGATVDPYQEMWSEKAFNDRLAVLPGWLSIGTGCYGPVKGIMRLHDNEPDMKDVNSFDHIVEGSMTIKSGVIELIPCTANKAEYVFNVNPGDYRIRILSAGLDTVKGDEGDDFYQIDIWPSHFKNSEVLKRH